MMHVYIDAPGVESSEYNTTRAAQVEFQDGNWDYQVIVDGLHDPTKRPRADDWEKALVHTADMLLPCSSNACKGKWFVFDNKQAPTCPFCQTAYGQDVPILNLYSSRTGESFRPDNYRVTVYDGVGLYAWHANRFKSPNERLDQADRKRRAYFQKHQGHWHMVNEGLPHMRDVVQKVPIGIGESVVLHDGAQILLDTENGGRLVQVQLVGALDTKPI